jgi:hypothetical protein
VDKFKIPHFLAALIDSCGASNFAVTNSDRLLYNAVLVCNGFKKSHIALSAPILIHLIPYPLEEMDI